MTIVEVQNIYTDDLFKWARETTLDSCGDGNAYIVCSNVEETAKWFFEYCQKQSTNWTFEKVVTDQYYIGDNQEGVIISNEIPVLNWHGDYVFIVKENTMDWKNNKVVQKI